VTTNTHGGARAGAGRPRNSEKYATQIAAATDQIAEALGGLVANMLALANGVRIQEANPVTGNLEIYQKPPDRGANIYLIDRIAGKPVQATELSGPDGGAIPLAIEDAIAKVYGAEDGD